MTSANNNMEYDELLSVIESKTQAIADLIGGISHRLKRSPKGYLRIVKKGHGYQYYLRSGKEDIEGKYLPISKRGVAIGIAQRDYDQKLLQVLEKQQKIIGRFLNEYDPGAVRRVYEELSNPRKQLVTPMFLTEEEFVKQWQNEPYDRLGFGKEEPEYYTARGERVRSKSEILIADALYRHKIPYRYEFPVYNKGVIIAAPDFNCLNVRLRKEYFWEHLGMMGEEKYADRNVKKLEKYTFAEDFDETNLIITMETDNKPLDTRVIDEKIRRFLL